MLRLFTLPTSICLTLGVFVSLSHAAPEPAAQKKVSVPNTARVTGFPDWVTSVAISPDGKYAAGGSYGVVQIYDIKGRKSSAKIKLRSGQVRSLVYSQDGSKLFAGSYQRISIIDTATNKVSKTLKGHRGDVTSVSLSSDGNQLISSSVDMTARIWNAQTGDPIRVITGHDLPVMGAALSPDGNTIATAAGDDDSPTVEGRVRLFESDGKLRLELVNHLKAATGIKFSPDGSVLVTSSFDEKVNVYDAQSGKALGYFAGHGRPVNAVLFAGDSKTLISVSGGRAKGKNEIIIWQLEPDGQLEIAKFEGHKAKITSAAISKDGRTLVTGSYDQSIALWDVSKAVPSASAAADTKVEQKLDRPEPPALPEDPPAKKATATVERANDTLVATRPLAAANAASLLTFNAKLQADAKPAAKQPARKQFRAGIIGLDTSHVIAFTKLLNDKNVALEVAGCPVVAAYPKGSPDIESSTSRVAGYTEQMKGMGVEIVDSIDALLEKVDVVFLETNDGRPHLEQLLPCLKAGKPTFIDKPVSGSLADAIAIYKAAEKYKVPVFSSSSLRFSPGAQALRNGSLGKILGCETYSPCSLEKTHPDLYWYGIHGVETLFTVMGAGCESVTRTSTPGQDVVVGKWKEGRIGTFRGIRIGKSGYGGVAYGEKGIGPVGPYGGYKPLVVEIIEFFNTGKPPVSSKETLEIYAFMEAADESKRNGGKPVTLESVMKKATIAADKRLAELDK